MYTKSIEDLKKACESKNNDPTSFHCLGLSYLKNQDYEEALEKITKAIELDDSQTSYYNHKALALYHLSEM